MPLEVREIGIFLRVGQPKPAPAQAIVDETRDEVARDAIVEDCVRRVLAILKTLRER